MLTANDDDASSTWHIVACWAIDTSISSGSSETDRKELAVIPCSSPVGARHVTTVTPVGNAPQTRRNERRSTGGTVMIVVLPGSISIARDPWVVGREVRSEVQVHPGAVP
ncbi:hypothetical protein GCM10009789_76570 [Kribbella sancticallisti]|uniref:Uncharacterized protein n=1 Tax=Kribbella sancticallisti TaxID=460087 RepID=A0ABN2EQM3_9ACTN